MSLSSISEKIIETKGLLCCLENGIAVTRSHHAFTKPHFNKVAELVDQGNTIIYFIWISIKVFFDNHLNKQENIVWIKVKLGLFTG